jgi:fused signal recognition particle receptor
VTGPEGQAAALAGGTIGATDLDDDEEDGDEIDAIPGTADVASAVPAAELPREDEAPVQTAPAPRPQPRPQPGTRPQPVTAGADAPTGEQPRDAAVGDAPASPTVAAEVVTAPAPVVAAAPEPAAPTVEIRIDPPVVNAALPLETPAEAEAQPVAPAELPFALVPPASMADAAPVTPAIPVDPAAPAATVDDPSRPIS